MEINVWESIRGLNIELDDDMIRLLDKAEDIMSWSFVKLLNSSYLFTVLSIIIFEMQEFPDKYSFKDFETANRMIKQINTYDYKFDIESKDSDIPTQVNQSWMLNIEWFRFDDEYIEI